MATGDIIPANNTTWRTIRSGDDLGTSWVYFTGTRIQVVKGSTTFGHSVQLEINYGTNTSPLWSRMWTTSGSSSSTFTYTIPYGTSYLPSWRIRREKSGLFIGNPSVAIYIQYWVGSTGKYIYYYKYVTGVSSSYVNPEYKTHSGTKILDSMKYNMSY